MRKIKDFTRRNIYTNDTIILFEQKKLIKRESSALIKDVSEDSVENALSFQNKHYIDVFRRFLNLGDRGFYGYLNGECVHRIWCKINAQKVRFHWAYFHQLKDGEAYIHYAETAPRARAKGIYSHVLFYISEKLANYRYLITVNEENIASIKISIIQLKTGFLLFGPVLAIVAIILISLMIWKISIEFIMEFPVLKRKTFERLRKSLK